MILVREAINLPVNRLLKMAVIGGVEAAVSLHIARGDDLNARDDRGMTLLMLAAVKNRARICRLLLDAGADPWATDTEGNDARGIALCAGAREASLEIERALESSRHTLLPRNGVIAANIGSAFAVLHHNQHTNSSSGGIGQPDDLLNTTSATGAPAIGPPGRSCTDEDRTATGCAVVAVGQQTSGTGYSLGDGALADVAGWEPDEVAPPPQEQKSLVLAPSAIHLAISAHRPIDDSADWSELEVCLPEHAIPVPTAEIAEAAVKLRLLLLRVIREGSVPSSCVDDLKDVGESLGSAASKTALRFVIEDMGAEIDERVEYRAPYESFEVYVAPVESSDEEQAINEALTFLDDLESHRNDPMRHYMREAQRHELLGADDEVALAKAMEAASKEAVDYLAEWPRGIEQVLEAIELVRSGEHSASSISTGARDSRDIEADIADVVDVAETSNALTEAVLIGDSEAEEEPDSRAEVEGPDTHGEWHLFATAQALRDRVEMSKATITADSSIRELLHEIRLSRPFLLQLATSTDGAEPVRRFVAATRRLKNARDRLTGANLRLVLTIAKRYLFSGIPMDDLIQEGNIGLLRAVDKFDWQRGYRFSTMATWWIRQQISRSVADTALAIRLPIHCHEDVRLIERTRTDIEKTLGRPPTFELIALRLAIKPEKVATLLRATSTPLSLDELDDELTNIGTCAPDPSVSLEVSQLGDALAVALDALDPKPAKVVRLRFGIDVAESWTLEEVGHLFDVTRERIRQIENKAIKRLADSPWAETLRAWLDGASSPRKPKLGECAPETEASRLVGPEPVMTAADVPVDETGLDAVGRLLAHAARLGIPVERRGTGISSAIWVRLDEPKDSQMQDLVRQLVAIGFAHWPGHGYWK